MVVFGGWPESPGSKLTTTRGAQWPRLWDLGTTDSGIDRSGTANSPRHGLGGGHLPAAVVHAAVRHPENMKTWPDGSDVRAWRPALQPVRRPAVRFSAACEKCGLVPQGLKPLLSCALSARLNRLRKNSEGMAKGRNLGDVKPSASPCGSLLEHPGAIRFSHFLGNRVFPQPVKPCPFKTGPMQPVPEARSSSAFLAREGTRLPGIRDLARPLRAGRPSVQPVWRPALQILATC